MGARGVSRASIVAAVEQVAARLQVPNVDRERTDRTAKAAGERVDDVVIAVSAESMPDLASRFRQKLTAAGVAGVESGVATVGRHTVLTLRTPAANRPRVEEVATQIGARVLETSRHWPAGTSA